MRFHRWPPAVHDSVVNAVADEQALGSMSPPIQRYVLDVGGAISGPSISVPILAIIRSAHGAVAPSPTATDAVIGISSVDQALSRASLKGYFYRYHERVLVA